MTKFLRLAFPISCCIIIFLLLREPPCFKDVRQLPKISRVNKTSSLISIKSIFVYKGYLDRRQGLNVLRILALNRCRKGGDTFLSILVENKWLPLNPLTIESGCPWSWARGCSLVPHYHEVALPNSFNQTEVVVKSSNGIQQTIQLLEVLVQKEEGLTVCVPPIYWYTDWVKLLVFVEFWRLSGATQFFFYHHSSSVYVEKVFDYYGQEDWMSVIPWPLLPGNDLFDPNFFVYRVGHSLAHNDCMLRSTTNRAVLVDVDELIYARNNSLLSLVNSTFQNETVGGVVFNHHTLQYDPPLNPSPFDFAVADFNGVLNPSYAAVKGPKKVLFDPATVKRLGVHGVTQYLRNRIKTVQVKEEKAILLHNRYNHKELTGNATQMKFALVPEAKAFRQTLLKRRKEIFPNGASFNSETQETLAACTDNWRNTQNNCKNPVEGCRHVMQPLEQWVEATDDLYLVF